MKGRTLISRMVNMTLAVLLAANSFMALIPAQPVQAAGNLTLTIIAAPNLVVDSNALSPSTYSPKVATVIAKVCNTGPDPVNNVTAYIGNYTGSGAGTPGIYPTITDATIGPAGTQTTYNGTYNFIHLGRTADAARFLGTLAVGECRYQYWSFEYPLLANGGTIPTWGNHVKPDDDLYLDFDMWVGGDVDGDGTVESTEYVDDTHRMYMRNEISAMANKIKPNGNPAGEWFNTDTSTVYPGQTVTTNGILYRLGNVNQGFDNDGDGVPDYNAWLQPFGDPAYDPSCFRLVGVTGTLTVTRGSGNPDMIIPIYNNLYFTNLPPDNTDVRGEVFYEFLALGGACTVPITPYQEVASGSDNEKFNGDYGTGVPALMSYEPEVILNKNGDATVSEPGTITYNIPFYNDSETATAGLTLSAGAAYAPLMIEDTVPEGLAYVNGQTGITLDYVDPDTGHYTIYYSTDSGATWSTTEPANGTLSSGPINLVVIRWVLEDPLPVKPGSGTNTSAGTATFQASVPSTYSSGGNSPLIENCAQANFGSAAPFAEACADTLVLGTGSIGDLVWADVNRDASQTGESGISGIHVYLYYDKNGDGKLDSGDRLVAETETSGTGASNYDFTQLPAGNYIVKVDTTDADLPTGYGPTTASYYAVTLSAGEDYNDADFGFGPTLQVNKSLLTPDPAVVGETVTFEIELTNQLPGDGTATGGCVYYVWPTTIGTGNFVNSSYAAGAPDGQYATTDLDTGSGRYLSASSFSSGGRTSNITSVEAVARLYLAAKFNDDTLNFEMTGGASTWAPGNLAVAYVNDFAPGEGYVGYLYSTAPIPDANAPGGAWDWQDFDAALALDLSHVKTTGPEKTYASINVDALGFRITTDDTSCVSGDTTIAILPLEDTYDTTYLEFLSADPPHTSHDGSTGTIYWENLGPLYAGGVRSVTVNFKALATIASPGTTNTASVTDAKFSSGRDVNDDNDSAQVYNIDTGYSIEGYTWVDANNNGWSGTTGYDTIPTTDQALPNVQMDLYVCADADGLPIAQITNRNTACGSVTGEYWKLVETIYTDGDGYYLFDGLRPGYYNVQANGTALPAGMTTRSAEAVDDANGDGGTGGDGEWNEQAGRIRDLHYLGSSTSRTDVSFGYRNSTNGTVTGYVWQDSDRDNVWDDGELPIYGATATLWLCDPDPDTCTSVTSVTTDENGYYQFSNVTPTTGSQTYKVVITPPNGMAQSGDPEGGACYGGAGCDNQTTTTFTLAAGAAHGPDYFGYAGGLTIGDTLYTDWNGDGDQDTGEEGIGGVKVRIYRDVDGDGVIDAEDTLLNTYDTLYNIIAGGLDVNNDGIIDANDARTLFNGYQIIDGKIDLNGGGVGDTDDGTFMGYTVIDGLIDVNGGGVDSTDNDSVLGFYEFSDLPGNGTDYLVMVDSGTLPAGYVQTDDRDGVLDNKTVITLTNADVDNADFGYQPTGFSSIGDFVWNDINANGVQDASEPGVNGVLVNLYQDQDGDGVIDSEDALVATTLTGIAVINGYINVDGDTVTDGDTGDDSPSLLGIRVIDGKLDLNNDGVVNTSDDGTFVGYTVIDGLLDINGIGGVTGDDDGTLDGLYQFRDLPAGDYIVEIPDSNFDASTDPLYKMLQTYDQDTSVFGDFDNQDQIALGANENYTGGDFGYAASSIGDFIWKDSNGDGLWENGEVGISGVVVELYLDADNNGVADGAAIATATTDSDGLYLFGGLAPNNYLVKVQGSPTLGTGNFASGGALEGYTLTGDPNSYNTTAGETSLSCLATGAQECDGENWLKGITVENADSTTTFFYGLQLGYNDMSSDFGYQPPALIGDFIWQDFNGDGVQDRGEPGIAGVTVNLYEDDDNDGVIDAEDALLATVTTNSDGYYYFTGRPAGNYIVQINPGNFASGQPLEGYTQTGDPEGDNNNIGDADTTGSVSDLSNDFGYQGSAVVAGTVFFDRGTLGGLYESGDVPFPGVPVYLYDSTGALVGSTLTDSDGHYKFNVATGTYTIRVGQALSTRVNGMTLTYEPDEAEDTGYCGSGSLTCNNATSVNTSDTDALTQDFGYFAAIDMGDLPSGYNYTITMIEEGPIHINASGAASPTIYLGSVWDSELDGAPDANAGMNSPSPTTGDDIVGIDDEDGVHFLNTWQTGGTAQLEFTVTNKDTNNYKPYLIGWFDWDNSGDLYGGGEMAISQDIVCLPADSPCTVQIDVPIPSNAYVGNINMRFRIYATQSPPPIIAPTGTVINGEVEDYQRNNAPTAITLAAFEATPQDEAILVTWETAMELDNVGFNLYRSTAAAGPYTRLNTTLIPPQFPGEPMGGVYEWLDADVQPGVTYFYKLEDIDVKGVSTFHGPVSTAVVTAPTAVRLQRIDARSVMSPLVVGLIAVMGLGIVRRRRR